MGLRLTGSVYVFKNENGRYTTSISNKKEDGTYDRVYVQVQFKKGVELESKTKINIKDAFLTFFRTQEGNVVYKIVVLDFEQDGETKEPKVGFEAKASDLPF